jgi:hypothetical protein
MLNWLPPEPNETTAAKLGAAKLATVAKAPAATITCNCENFIISTFQINRGKT